MSSSESNSLSVLLVEDDPLVRCTIRRCLETLGLFVQEAEDCYGAEDIWQSNRVDLVVCDYRLPDGLGVELIESMREKGFKTAVISLTAESEEIDDEMRGRLNISEVVGKPVDLDELSPVVERVVGTIGGGSSPEVSRQAGRYTIVDSPVVVTVDELLKLSDEVENPAWIAVDMSGVREIDEGAYAEMVNLAMRHSVAGGRLCIFNVPDKLRSEDAFSKIESDIDIFSNQQEVESNGRKLTSACERSSVLGSVVARNED